MMDDFTIAEKEKFNMGSGYYARCNELLTKIQMSKLTGNFSELYVSLLCLYSELDAKCNDKQRIELENHVKMITNLFKLKKLTDIQLLDFELQLRRIMEAKNMLTPKSEDPSAALGRM